MLRHVDSELEGCLKEKLLKEREVYLEEHPNYRMLGADFVCAEAVIHDICCNHARYINSEDTLTTIYDIIPIL